MNDVRRALLFWPAFTSALIILIALISPLEDESWNLVAKRIQSGWSTDAVDFDTAAAEGPGLRDSGPATLQPIETETTIQTIKQDMFGDNVAAVEPSFDADPSSDRPVGISLLARIPFDQQLELESERQQEDSPDLECPIPNEPTAKTLVEFRTEKGTPSVTVQPEIPAEKMNPPRELRESIMPKSIVNLARLWPRQDDTDHENQPLESVDPYVRRARNEVDAITKPAVTGNPSTWPLTPRLNEQLDRLTQHRSASSPITNGESEEISWAAQVRSALNQLADLPRLGDPAAGSLIEELDRLAEQGLRNAENVTERQSQISYLQTAYALVRRVAVWQPVWSLVSHQPTSPAQVENVYDTQQINAIVAAIESDIKATGDADGWAEFLMLDTIVDAAAGDEVNQRGRTAQRVLSRIQWQGLDPIHRQWLDRDSVHQLIAGLQPWAQTPIDYAALLNQIERQESDAIDLAAIDIADATQTLRFSDNPAALRVASAIDTHYRNANIRTAISQEMLRRLIPTMDPTTVPVRTNMLGSRVNGVSHIKSQLDLRLQPAAGSWSFLLQTQGNVQTRSVGKKGTTAVKTHGESNFVAATPIAITPIGVDVGDSSIDVQGNTRLRDVNSQYDNWPLLGSLARSIIAAKYNERSRLTSRIANRRMRTKIIEGIDERLDLKVAKSTSRLNDVIMGPLNTLKLQPTVIDMQTTNQRLIARYRLANDWQIGASTPRPRAPSDSLLSVQIHQSALNNTLEQVVPSGEPTTIQDAFDNTMEIFGREKIALPADIPNDVEIQFAKARPITVELEDGVLWITMRVVELSRPQGGKLNRFIVRAGYRAEVDGLRTSLVREGHLRISGPGMSMRQRLPIRAVFNKVFSPNHKIPLSGESFAQAESLAECEISQLEIRDGWFALAVSPARPDRIAVGVSNNK